MEDLGRKNARLFQDIARSFREVLEISVNLHPLSSHSVNFLVANWEHPVEANISKSQTNNNLLN